MQNFILDHPTRVVFGRNSFATTGKEIAKLGKKVFIITIGSSIKKEGYLNSLLELLDKERVEYQVLDSIKGEPSIDDVNKGFKVAKKYRAKIFIGFGGGSAIDAAKAISACAKNSSNLQDLLASPKEFEAFPIIAIPTTAGTGSELSRGSIISDLDSKIKKGLRSNSLIPTLAIVDPELTLTVPPQMTAVSGFDAFAHAVESLLSKKANLYTKMCSKEAISVIFKNLPIAYNNPKNMQARENLSFMSMIMGYNLLYAGTCMPHRIQYSFGTISGMSHGLGLSILYRSWFRKVIKADEEKSKIIASSLGMLPEDLSSPVWAGKLFKIIDGFMNRLGLTRSLGEFNIGESDIDALVLKIEGSLDIDPAYKDNSTLREILLESL